MALKSRIFNIMQYEKHPDTDEVLLSEDTIKVALLSHRMIKRWAYIKHDKDVYSALDEEAYEQRQVDEEKQAQQELSMHEVKQQINEKKIKKGDVKPAHWHIVVELKTNQIEIGVIAKWFGIKDNYINVAKGAGAFLDCVQYLTHEGEKQQELGKRLYEDTEVHANFDFRNELDDRAEKKLKYGRDLDTKTELRYKVLHGELTIRDVRKKYEFEYIEDREKLLKLRLDFIQNSRPPRLRHNFYICGSGGVGKDVASVFLARALYPDIKDDDDLFFTVGADGSTFEGYDGQPVIIWSDCRSHDLLKKLGSRGNVFNVFDTAPKKQNQNIKYGATNLVNSVNIVNSIQPYIEFFNGLVGEYKDKSGDLHTAEDNEKIQSYRRFPFIMPLRADDFDILINRTYLNGEGDYEDYIKYLRIRGNFAKLIKNAPPGSLEIVNVSTGMVRPLVDARDKIEERQKSLEKNEFDKTKFDGWGIPADKLVVNVDGKEKE